MNRLTFTTAISLMCLLPTAAYALPVVPETAPIKSLSQANPWDKYVPASDAVEQDSESNPAVAPAAEKQLNKPVDADEEPSGDANVGLPPAQGDPWDKYLPVPSPSQKAAPDSPAAQPKVKKSKPTELAVPLKVRPLPQNKPVVKNRLKIGEEKYFAVEYAGKLVGYSNFHISNLINLGGHSTYVIESKTRIKIGQEAIQDLKFAANTQVNSKTLVPASFFCAQFSNNKDSNVSVNCVYSDSLIAQKNGFGKKEQTYIQELKNQEKPYLLYNNMWGHLDSFAEHYWLLVRAASNGGILEAYDPILQGLGKVVVYPPVKESWKAPNGKKVTTLLYAVTDMEQAPLAYVRVFAKDYELAEIREIGHGLTWRISNAGVMSSVNKISGRKASANSVLSNIYFQDPEKLTNMEVSLDLRLRGGELAQHEVSGFQQKFYGTLKEGRMEGRAVIKSTMVDTPHKSAFPFTLEVPADLQKYLLAGPGLELEVPQIGTKAKELTWKSENSFQAARRLTGYIANQIKNGYSLPSARQTLENGVGNSESKALLLCAMLRSLNIPTRQIGGLAYRNGSFQPHFWCEAWLGPDEGWTPFDPTTDESGFINASHVALCESGAIQSLEVGIDKFIPHPPRKVDFANRPLQWAIGEQRTYGIYCANERIGSETAHMYDMEVLKNSECYHLKADATLTRDGQVTDLKGETLVNTYGLPVRFHSRHDDGKIIKESAFTFENNRILQDMDAQLEYPSPARPAAPQAATPSTPAAAPTDSAAKAEGPAAKSESDPSVGEQVLRIMNDAVTGEKTAVQTPGPNDTKAAQAQAQAQANTPTNLPAQDSQPAASASDNDALSPDGGNAEDDALEASEKSQQYKIPQLTPEEAAAQAQAKAEREAAIAAAREKAVAKAEARAKQRAAGITTESDEITVPHQVRQIPYSNGTYLADQRFLSLWALIIEQQGIAGSASTPQPPTELSEPKSPEAALINIKSELIGDQDKESSPAPTTGSENSKNDSATKDDKAKVSEDTSDDETDDSVNLHIFVPDTLRSQELILQRSEQDETLEMPDGSEIEVTRLDSEKGMVFYVDNASGKVVKISIPSQELDIVLEKSEFSIDN